MAGGEHLLWRSGNGIEYQKEEQDFSSLRRSFQFACNYDSVNVLKVFDCFALIDAEDRQVKLFLFSLIPIVKNIATFSEL